MPPSLGVFLSLVGCVFACTGPTGYAQTAVPRDAPPRHVSFDHVRFPLFDQTEAILQDHEGFLWLGQRSTGLFKYDGYAPARFVFDPDNDHSLSNNEIRVLYEDRHGVLWIGTLGGLNRFDRVAETSGSGPGQAFTRFRHDPNDPGSLSDDHVHAVTEDLDGTLWVGTRAGLNRLDRKTGAFTRFYPDASNPASTGNQIRALQVDRSGTLWVGSWGLNRFDPETGGFTRFLPDPSVTTYALDDPDTYGNVIRALHEDAEGRLWVGTERGGLYSFDPGTRTFSNYRNSPRNPPNVVRDRFWENDAIRHIVDDPERGLWLGSWREGLIWLDPSAPGRMRTLRHDPLDPYSLGSNQITALYVDRQGILWVGNLNGGLARFDRAAWPFEHIYPYLGNAGGLSDGFVQSISEGPDGVLWVVARGVLNRIDRTADTYRYFRPDPEDPHSLVVEGEPGRGVIPVLADRSGAVWVGGGYGVLSRMDPDRPGHFTHIRHDPKDPGSLPPGLIQSLYEDRQGHLWVGTGDFILSRMEDRETGRFTRFALGDNPGYINSIVEDQAGLLWMGTISGGLSRFDPNTETIQHYRPETGRPDSLSSTSVFGVCENPKAPGVLWVAAYGRGLSRFDQRTETFTYRTAQHSALPDNGVQGVLCDEQGPVWVSTDNGLSRYDPDTDTFKSYDTGDGLQDLTYHAWAYHQSPYTGEMFFGGGNGLNAFFPGQIRDNPHPPQVVLSGLRLFGEPVRPGPDAPLRTSVAEARSVTFAHDQNDLTLEYVGLHFSHPEQNRYAYKLDPYNADWREVGPERSATFTNLDPGTYTFRVKASNSDGVWNEEGASLRITIRPPWWRTTWAYLIYGLFFAGGVFVVDRVQRRRLTRKERERAHRTLERTHTELKHTHAQLQKAQARLQSIDTAKSRFFANVSHEFRTPLTLIVGPLEDLQDGEYGALSQDALDQVGVAVNNSRRLLLLVNQLLDIARLEAGRLKLHVDVVDAAPFVGHIAQRFTSMAAHKRIDFRVAVPDEPVPVCVDADQIDKVVGNLLGNAFKFTPDGGRIVVEMTTEDDPAHDGWLAIAVRDTGPGIAPEHLPHLFERFYQADASSTRLQSGTGIGLALAHELAVLHHGTIDVESEVGRGSTFTLRLRLGEAHFSEAERAGSAATLPRHRSAFSFPALAGEIDRPDEAPLPVEEGAPPQGEDVTTVLVVDDNAHVRAYVRRHLAPRYRVLEAADGQQALALAAESLPDLVVSDVMMPRMDGFALCEAIKSTPELNFIPVILLTAKASTDSKIEGFETGADAYMTKPFNVRELAARIDNLIESRRQWKARFGGETPSAPWMPYPAGLSSADEALLEQVHAAIAAHLSDETFGVQELASAVGQSRASLYRRFDALPDQSPTDLIWRMRLVEAAHRLRSGTGTVGEVAYSVGFKSVSHFSKRFKEHFGKSPTAYVSEAAASG